MELPSKRPDDMARITTPELAQAFIAEQIEAIRARCCMCVLARPIRAVKAVFFNIKVNALLF